MSGVTNQGVVGYIANPIASFPSNSITIDIFGNTFYRNYSFGAGDDTGVYWSDKIQYSERQMLFIAAAIGKTLKGKYDYGHKLRSSQSFDFKIPLPKTTTGKIDFAFMEDFVHEIEKVRLEEIERLNEHELNAYLEVTCLSNYTLTKTEKDVIDKVKNNKIHFEKYTYKAVFNRIKQGRRLKKEDQKQGSTPFVMSGVTNTGVVGYVANPVAVFPANSITVDIFGNTFYRNYVYGAGDDTGCYWNDQKQYSKEQMLFFATSIAKSLKGKYSFGKKLRSSQSHNFCMILPTKNGAPDYEMMETIIRAVQKLVIKDIVISADRRLAATKKTIEINE